MKRDTTELAELAVLAGVLAIAATASYLHLREVWIAAGAPIVDVGPLLVDGLFAAAWLRMRRRRRQAEAVGWLAWAALLLALAATVAGNLAAAWISGHRDPLSLVVAAWPAVAFALVWELVTGHGRGRLQPPPAAAGQPETFEEMVSRLVNEEGMGREKLAETLGIREWRARKLLETYRQPQEEPA